MTQKTIILFIVWLAISIIAPSFGAAEIPSAAPKRSNPFNAVVAQDGSGDYHTIQQAIDRVPTGRTTPWLIFVKSGRYQELVRIPIDKPFIHLIGQQRDSVVITFKINCSDPERPNDEGKAFSKKKVGQSDCATVVIDASDFYAENISFENAWGVEEQKGPQALAIKTNNDKFAFYNCRFRSFQDTWMTSTRGINDRTYAANCWIEGAVDYVYGGGNAYVEKSTFYNVRSGAVIVAPSHREGTKWGYVFDHCVVDGNLAAADGRVKLGRPWHNLPIAVYLNTTMKITPHPEGWTDMGPAAKLFAEYNSRATDGSVIDLNQRRTWYKQSAGEGGQKIDGLKSQLTQQEAKVYTYKNIIIAGDGWDPRTFYQSNDKPVLKKDSGGNLQWERDKQSIGYIIFKDGKILGFTTLNSFKIPKRRAEYMVQGINKFGSLGIKSDLIN